MSEEEPKVIRMPMGVGRSTHRRMEERVALRFPRLLNLGARTALRLPRRSRLRQALLRRAFRLGWEAHNRGDYEAGFVFYHPDVEAIFPSELSSIGSLSDSHGREERTRLQVKWGEEWGEFRFEPEELIDLGDGRFCTVGRVAGTGSASGVASDSDWAVLHVIAAGQVIREEVFLDRNQALETAGLSE